MTEKKKIWWGISISLRSEKEEDLAERIPEKGLELTIFSDKDHAGDALTLAAALIIDVRNYLHREPIVEMHEE